MRRTAEGFCIIYEDSGESLPIGELKQLQAEKILDGLIEKYGPRFHRSRPTSKRSHVNNARLDKLLEAKPIHGRTPDAATTICGAVVRRLTACDDPTSDRITDLA